MSSLSDIDDLLDAAVDVGSNDRLMVTRTNKDGTVQSRQVVTGREYLELSAQGYRHDGTTYGLSIESWHVQAVGWVPYLIGAEPAATSFIRDLSLENVAVADLPWELAPLLEGTPDSREASWQAAVPDAKVMRATPHELEIVGGGMKSILTIVAWADVNGDGIEDVLLYRTTHAVKGTYRVYHHCVLTRLHDGDLLRIVAIDHREVLARWYRPADQAFGMHGRGAQTLR